MTEVVSPVVASAPARLVNQTSTMVAPSEVVDLIDRPVNAEETLRVDAADATAPPQWHASFAQVVAKAAIATANPAAGSGC